MTKRTRQCAGDEDVLSCSVCDDVMRVSHGMTDDFCGCINDLACTGTRDIAVKAAGGSI